MIDKKEKKEIKEEKASIVPEKFASLIKQIEEMTVLDLAELIKILEKKFEVSAVAQPVISTVAKNNNVAETTKEVKEEKVFFDIKLQAIGENKIEIIKIIRDLTAKGLKDSKDLADAVAQEPQMIKEKVKKEEAEEIKKKFEAAGAKVELL